MNPLAKLLNEKRNQLGKSLREIGEGHFSTQALSNYERGHTLPESKSLVQLAECYGLDIEKVRRAYEVALPRALAGTISQRPFVDLLMESIQKEDHLLVVTQQSLVVHRPEVATSILELVRRGAHFTYVAFIPPSGEYESQSQCWRSNHPEGASILLRYWNAQPEVGGSNAGKLSYLLIGNPDAKDYMFLRGYGAWVYLCKRGFTSFEHTDAWMEMRSPQGDHLWTSCDEGFISGLHDWLARDCGVQLPTPQMAKSAISRTKARSVRLESLEDFVRKQG